MHIYKVTLKIISLEMVVYLQISCSSFFLCQTCWSLGKTCCQDLYRVGVAQCFCNLGTVESDWTESLIVNHNHIISASSFFVLIDSTITNYICTTWNMTLLPEFNCFCFKCKRTKTWATYWRAHTWTKSLSTRLPNVYMYNTQTYYNNKTIYVKISSYWFMEVLVYFNALNAWNYGRLK